ncbi:exported hypothetical protein [Gammaproteobacteria bacterium]
MFTLKTCTIMSLPTLALAFFVSHGGATEESSVEVCQCAERIQERLKTIEVEFEQARQTANERNKTLEKSLATTEHQATGLQSQNLNLQERLDMAHEDVDLMRAEMRRCTGDRAHLDDVISRYQASQAQLYDIQQRLRAAETTLAEFSREHDRLKSDYDWTRKRLDATLQENDKLRFASKQNTKTYQAPQQ